ncbi:MAG: EAL domain-containing protein [Herminiimonas sp.]|nr:EAL domain-containing protein [Herminiimonas sp.]
MNVHSPANAPARAGIVAEGVETLGQYDFLKSHHCDKFQGYLFSKAVPADALSDFGAGFAS